MRGIHVRDLSAIERTQLWLKELLIATRKPGKLHDIDPALVADVARNAKTLRTSLEELQMRLNKRGHRR